MMQFFLYEIVARVIAIYLREARRPTGHAANGL
jgi:hypothetical protein